MVVLEQNRSTASAPILRSTISGDHCFMASMAEATFETDSMPKTYASSPKLNTSPSGSVTVRAKRSDGTLAR